MKTNNFFQSVAIILSVLFAFSACSKTDNSDILDTTPIDHIAIDKAQEGLTIGGSDQMGLNSARLEAIVIQKDPFVFQINRYDPKVNKIRSNKYQLPAPYFLKIGQISANDAGYVTLTGDILRQDQVFSELFVIRFDDVGEVVFNLMAGLPALQFTMYAYVDAGNQVFIHGRGLYEPGYQSLFVACIDEEGGLKFATQYLKADQQLKSSKLVDGGTSVQVSSIFKETAIDATIDKYTGAVTNFDMKYFLSGLLPEHGLKLKLVQRGIPVKKLHRFFDGVEADEAAPDVASAFQSHAPVVPSM